MESFQTVWKVSEQSGKFPDSLESFRTVWNFFGQSGRFLTNLKSFWTAWKVSGQFGRFTTNVYNQCYNMDEITKVSHQKYLENIRIFQMSNSQWRAAGIKLLFSSFFQNRIQSFCKVVIVCKIAKSNARKRLWKDQTWNREYLINLVISISRKAENIFVNKLIIKVEHFCSNWPQIANCNCSDVWKVFSVWGQSWMGLKALQ